MPKFQTQIITTLPSATLCRLVDVIKNLSTSNSVICVGGSRRGMFLLDQRDLKNISKYQIKADLS